MVFPILKRIVFVLALAAAPAAALAGASTTDGKIYRGHGIAMHGEPKYPPDFGHFGYVNPDAPKGGTARLSAEGGYDSFNPFIVKGRSAERRVGKAVVRKWRSRWVT